MDKIKAGNSPIALSVLKELVLPLAGGVAYGTIVAQAKQMPLDGVTAGGVAFFCLLAAQGLVLRAARNARDDHPATRVAPDAAPEAIPDKAPELAPAPAPANDFVSIRLGIEELKELGALPDVAPEKGEDGQKGLFRNLARSPARRTPVEALAPRQLLDLKMPYQAVLNAAVNFEREIRRRADVAGDRTIPLEHLFEHPRFALSKEQLKQLDTLRRVRNSILHGFEALVDPVEAADLVAAFDQAASWFDPVMDGQRHKADVDRGEELTVVPRDVTLAP